MPTQVTAGQRWKVAREAAGLSVLDAAKLGGVHRNTIYDLEKDDEGVTLRLMKHVAAVYGVTLSDIFCDEPTRERVPADFRPLADLLEPLDAEARQAFIRNVAANARFMARLVTVPTPSKTGATNDQPETYNSAHTSSDVPADGEFGVAVIASTRSERYEHADADRGQTPRPTPRKQGQKR